MWRKLNVNKIKMAADETKFSELEKSLHAFSFTVEFCTCILSPYFKTFMEIRNRFQGMNSASLCSLAGRYDNPLPTRFLAPTDCLKIPALYIIFTAVAGEFLCLNSGWMLRFRTLTNYSPPFVDPQLIWSPLVIVPHEHVIPIILFTKITGTIVKEC